MKPFEIRPAGADDLDAIAAGFARACGKPPSAVRDKVRWAFASNPAGWTGVVAVGGGGEVAAHFGVSHVPMSVLGEPGSFGRVYASWVEPALRIAGVHGVFGQMDDLLQELAAANSLDALYGIFLDGDWWTLRRLREFEPVRTDLELVRRAGPHARGTAKTGVVRLDADAAPRLEGGIALGGFHARRDAPALLFRTGGPFRGDAAWVAIRDGRPAGVAIVRETGAGRTVLDFAVPEGDEDAADALFDQVIGDGSRAVTLPWFSRSPWFLVAQRKGFRAAASDLHYIGVRAVKSRVHATALMQSWQALACDLGLRPNPRFLADEETVTTAPMGTRTAKDRRA